MVTLSSIPQLALGSILYYGAFSRLTHGKFTPSMYAYQNVRQPDDGSTTAMLVPVMDVMLGSTLLFGSRRAKRIACLLFGAAQGAGIYLMVSLHCCRVVLRRAESWIVVTG
jgi:hypothetical protein